MLNKIKVTSSLSRKTIPKSKKTQKKIIIATQINKCITSNTVLLYDFAGKANLGFQVMKVTAAVKECWVGMILLDETVRISACPVVL